MLNRVLPARVLSRALSTPQAWNRRLRRTCLECACAVQSSKYAASVEQMTKENGVLKRAVAIQHARMNAAGEKDLQIVQQQGLLEQYQERVRTLELSNYSLSIHLKQATGMCSMDRGPPDVC